ncbi:hypothetical protein H6G81_07960 [Scytonema hofmannii FACHB-248]|uniref:Uncharacterized protein n=1 Tax=Scytonema hofmannii FACHB-248 TaxID=1842502 RepID=A0ABR8GM23_9CYAN|nr:MULTISPECIES: hypothetical protein [Nostocales]MBD2604466.1 hypothetical protein [Scytonema hofmannii FACHB-248]
MSTAVKNSRKRKTYAIASRIGKAIALSLILCGCNAPSFLNSGVTWKTYTNSRYGFEFLYPSTWTSLPPPENNDGIAFVSPQNTRVEIRGWAGKPLPDNIITDKNVKKTINPNFKTNQGVSGVLEVEVGSQESSMRLTLTTPQVKYYWQGRSPASEFSNYYRVFYYIAQEYRISGKEWGSGGQGGQGE